jgi:hypothetical protein
MSSTQYSGTQLFSHVIPFPAPVVAVPGVSVEATERFDHAVGALERVMDILAVAAGVWSAYWIGVTRINPGVVRYSRDGIVTVGVGFGLLVVLLLEKYGDYRPDISLLAVRETERLLRVQ